jgi:carbonic anhydrase
MKHRLTHRGVFALLTGLALAPGAFAEEGVEWGYEGDIGPAYWSRLTWDYAICEQGVHQSPIDLTEANEIQYAQMERVMGTVAMDVERRAEVMDVLDNGHTVQITSDADIGVSIDGRDYGLLQFHFHSPSEHTLNGQSFPLEAHFVMGNEAGHLAVISYLFEAGEANEDYAPIVAGLPQNTGEKRKLEDLDFDLNAIKPLSGDFFAYSGSLTTPPCSEGVIWMVHAKPQELSAEQLSAFTRTLDNNNRPVQPRHVRQLLLVTSEKP